VVSFAPLLLYLRGKRPQYPLDKPLGGPQSQSGRHGEEKILILILIVPPIGIGTPTLGRPARSQSLYRLRYPDSY
jgi:hypothetical protein